MSTNAAAWYADPSRRHEVRYWNGEAWTEHVADNGVASVDPVTADDGLAVTTAMVRDAPSVLVPGGLLALEVDERRAARVAALVRDDGRYRAVEIGQDLTGRDRFVLATRL